MNSNILALVFLVAGTMLLATTAVTTMVPAAYADNDAEDDSLSQRNDCDENDISGSTPNFNDVCENNVDSFTADD
ncbi:MAG TPA: hypothetical protein VFS97_13380 [Nitrososphaeraceae archaeon]|nr:hypothetical protein [Nitrososphaeraceae archaeon]